jgi:hypothetical protein
MLLRLLFRPHWEGDGLTVCFSPAIWANVSFDIGQLRPQQPLRLLTETPRSEVSEVSVFSGPAPEVRTFGNHGEENSSVSAWPEERSREGVMSHEIGVFARWIAAGVEINSYNPSCRYQSVRYHQDRFRFADYSGVANVCATTYCFQYPLLIYRRPNNARSEWFDYTR